MLDLSACDAHLAVLAPDRALHLGAFGTRAPSWEQAEDYLVSNVADELRYHQFKLKRPPVSEFLATGRIPSTADAGNGAEIAPPSGALVEVDFLKKMGLGLGVAPIAWSPLKAMAWSPDVTQKVSEFSGDLPSFAVSLGLALRRQ